MPMYVDSQDLPPAPDLLGGHLHLRMVVTTAPVVEGCVERLVTVLPGRGRLRKGVGRAVD